MLKLNSPNFSIEQAIDACCEGIVGNPGLLQKVQDDRHYMQTCCGSYALLAPAGQLYTIPSVSNSGVADPVIFDQLKKSELVSLYKNYFSKDGKPGREIYDSLLAAANEKCPYCGGVGRPRNLDHYLPKTHYPQFSVLPVNLVPSCRDCNMDGKGDGFATREVDQVIHPYLDNDRYFHEQWISARYVVDPGNEPGVIEYFVQPPVHWDDAQKQRVQKHFDDFDLDLRFSKEASSRLIIYLGQIQNLANISVELEVAKTIVLQPAIDSAPFVNHWERVMCLALINDLV